MDRSFTSMFCFFLSIEIVGICVAFIRANILRESVVSVFAHRVFVFFWDVENFYHWAFIVFMGWKKLREQSFCYFLLYEKVRGIIIEPWVKYISKPPAGWCPSIYFRVPLYISCCCFVCLCFSQVGDGRHTRRLWDISTSEWFPTHLPKKPTSLMRQV